METNGNPNRFFQYKVREKAWELLERPGIELRGGTHQFLGRSYNLGSEDIVHSLISNEVPKKVLMAHMLLWVTVYAGWKIWLNALQKWIHKENF